MLEEPVNRSSPEFHAMKLGRAYSALMLTFLMFADSVGSHNTCGAVVGLPSSALANSSCTGVKKHGPKDERCAKRKGPEALECRQPVVV